MKKLLFFISFIVTGISAQAQKFSEATNLDLGLSSTPPPAMQVVIKAKATKKGDTIQKSHIPATAPLYTYYIDNAPFDSGYVSGFNAFGDKGWAERFDIKGSDSSVLPLGVFGYVAGRSSATSTKTLRAAIWARGPKVGVSGRPKLFYGGVPTGSPVNSTTISFPNLRGSTTTGEIDTIIYMRFSTASANITDSFFAGFDIPSGYTWSSLGGDTLSVVTDTPGVRYGDKLASSLVYTVSGGDTTINTQNATLASSGTWYENYIGGGNGFYNNFFIGVVFRVQSVSVNGITRNDLTVFGIVPNPAVNSTNLKLSLKSASDVAMQIMDMSGRIVYTAPTQHLAAGAHDLPIATDGLASGVYNCIVRTSTGSSIGIEMTVAK